MTYSDDLREFLKWWEGRGGRPLLSPHLDTVATENRGYEVWDIGYGHVLLPTDEHRDITEEEAEMLLDYDLWRYDTGVSSLITYPVAQCQYDACVSFSYNVGLDIDEDDVPEGFGDSTLLKYLNSGQFDRASAEFPKWNKSGGAVVRGLTNRRAAERLMFDYGDYSGRPR